MYLVHIRKRKLKRNNMAEVVEKKKMAPISEFQEIRKIVKNVDFFHGPFFYNSVIVFLKPT